MRSNILNGATCALAIATLLIGNTPAVSQAADLSAESQLIMFNIEAQALAAALNAFALQTHQQILFPPELVRGKNTRGVKGNLSSDAALSKIFSGTGLTFSRSANGVILVSRANPRHGPIWPLAPSEQK